MTRDILHINGLAIPSRVLSFRYRSNFFTPNGHYNVPRKGLKIEIPSYESTFDPRHDLGCGIEHNKYYRRGSRN